MLTRSLAFLFLGLLLAGCGPARLNETKTLELTSEIQARSLDLPAVSKPQKINIEFSSSDKEVDVLVFKDEDVKSDDDLAYAASSKALGKMKGEKGTFTVDVPENTKTRVVARLGPAKKSNVKITVTNAP